MISSGKGNRYGHPHQEVVERLLADGVSLWRTDRDGTVDVRVDGKQFVVRGKLRRERFEVGER